MSLRKINKEKRRDEWGGPAAFFRDLARFKKPEHFTKHQKLHIEKKPEARLMLTTGSRKMSVAQERKDIMIIAVIAVAVIGVVLIELSISGSQQAPPTGNTSVVNQTPVNQTPQHVLKPDLIISSLSLSSNSVTEGDSVSITAVVKNKGDADAANVTVEFLVETSHLDDETTFSLGVNKTAQMSVNWTTTGSSIGQQTISAVADPNGVVKESDESNNEKEVQIEVKKDIVTDISETFKKMSILGLGESWYSAKYRVPPKSGEDYVYFSLSSGITSEYYLDVAIPGFKAVKIGNTSQIEIPDSSNSSWNRRWCIRTTQDSSDCVWNGPELIITLSFKSGKLIAQDMAKAKDYIATSDSKIKDIQLAGITTAKWPEDQLKTYKVYGGPEPNSFVPLEFYEIVGNKIYIHPMRWNPRTMKAEVATGLQFRIKTD